MKIVRLQNNRVAEIFPTETYEKGIAYWYNEAYAAASVEAPDDVEEGMVYDPATGAFSPAPIPTPEEPTEQDDIDAMLVDHEYRLTLMELGLT